MAGSQIQCYFSKKSVFFGGNTANYVIDLATQARGATLFDFFEFTKSQDNVYKIRFTKEKYHYVEAEQLYISKNIDAIIVVNQEISQIFDNNDRIAFLNLNKNGNIFQGIALRYRDIPESEIADFDEVLKTFRVE